MSRLKLISILIIALPATVLITTVVLWSLNRGPGLPPISYTPSRELADFQVGDIPDNNALPREEGGADSYISGYSPLTAQLSMELPAQLTQVEKEKIIEEKYRPIFDNLRSSYQKELDRMLSCAREDYEAQRAGIKRIPLSQLALDYLQAGRDLEGDCDRKFARVLEAMKRDLSRNNLPQDLADQAQKQYQEQKSQARSKLYMKMARYKND